MLAIVMSAVSRRACVIYSRYYTHVTVTTIVCARHHWLADINENCIKQ